MRFVPHWLTAGTLGILVKGVPRPGSVESFLWVVREVLRRRGGGCQGQGGVGLAHPRRRSYVQERCWGEGAGVWNLLTRERFEEVPVAGSAGRRRGAFASWSGAVCERTSLKGNSVAQGRFGTRGGDQLEALLQDHLPSKPLTPLSPPPSRLLLLH